VRDYIDLDTVPYGEDCAQVGRPNYDTQAHEEAERFIAGLRHYFGQPEEQGAALRIASNPHDFGSYYSVRVYYDDTNEPALAYAYMVEGHIPETWRELEETTYQPKRTSPHAGVAALAFDCTHCHVTSCSYDDEAPCMM